MKGCLGSIQYRSKFDLLTKHIGFTLKLFLSAYQLTVKPKFNVFNVVK